VAFHAIGAFQVFLSLGFIFLSVLTVNPGAFTTGFSLIAVKSFKIDWRRIKDWVVNKK
jgi:hypothetical protein